MRLFIILATLAAGFGPSVSHAAAQCGPDALDVPPLRDSLLVSTTWLAANLSRPDLVILQADHGRGAYEAGHVPGARFASVMDFAAGDMDLPSADALVAVLQRLGISNQTRVIMYGEPWHLGRVAVALDYLGHGDRWAVLDGGMAQWRAEGRPVSTDGPPPPSPTTYHPRVRDDIVVDAAWVRARLNDPRVAIIDARTPGEYAGTARESAPRTGHVPGARLLEWAATYARPAAALADTASPLIPADRLRRLFERAGATAGRQPVLYCTIGLRAAHLYFVARYLGYTPRLYDGSWSEWSRSQHPVATGSQPGAVR
jgi:thiosulfate/3-mercaptopyruvate sulfurtransferase